MTEKPVPPGRLRHIAAAHQPNVGEYVAMAEELLELRQLSVDAMHEINQAGDPKLAALSLRLRAAMERVPK